MLNIKNVQMWLSRKEKTQQSLDLPFPNVQLSVGEIVDKLFYKSSNQSKAWV